MTYAFICDAIRTPIGRLGGSLATVRADDLAAIPLRALMDRNPNVDWELVDDTILGCANQAGEDNRNIARMAVLLSGLPQSIPGATINRLCASGMDAVGLAARAIRSGDCDLMIAGGVESMTRAPYVMGKAEAAFGRAQKIEDTTLGWRFVNPAMKAAYGVETMPETAENVAAEFRISRDDQDAFALESQSRAAKAQASGRLSIEITPVSLPQRCGDPILFVQDEHLRETTADALGMLKPVVRANGTVTAGNASGLNDGAAAMIVASENAAKRNSLVPRARIIGMTSTAVAPSVMGIGPVEAIRSLLRRTNVGIDQIDVLELNEAFAAQAVACVRELGLDERDHRINPNGGAIALGHPLGMSGARITMTAVEQLHNANGRFAIASMCVGVGQGVALLLEKV